MPDSPTRALPTTNEPATWTAPWRSPAPRPGCWPPVISPANVSRSMIATKSRRAVNAFAQLGLGAVATEQHPRLSPPTIIGSPVGASATTPAAPSVEVLPGQAGHRVEVDLAARVERGDQRDVHPAQRRRRRHRPTEAVPVQRSPQLLRQPQTSDDMETFLSSGHGEAASDGVRRGW